MKYRYKFTVEQAKALYGILASLAVKNNDEVWTHLAFKFKLSPVVKLNQEEHKLVDKIVGNILSIADKALLTLTDLEARVRTNALRSIYQTIKEELDNGKRAYTGHFIDSKEHDSQEGLEGTGRPQDLPEPGGGGSSSSGASDSTSE